MKKVLSTIFMAVMLCAAINSNAQINISTDVASVNVGRVRAGQVLDAEIKILTLIPDNVISADAEIGWGGYQGLQAAGVALKRHTINVKALKIPDYAPEGPIEGTLNVEIKVLDLLGLPLTYILELPIEGEVIL